VLALRVVAGVSVGAWLWLLLARGFFWRTDIRLPVAPDPQRWPAVAIVVPARDEAEVLPQTLPTLVGQDYPGPVRLILVDDGSTDGTALVVRDWPTVEVVTPGPPPPGWAGKLWALQAGIAAAGPVELLLLTDADIAHPPDSLSRLVRVAEARRLDLVSQMAGLSTRTGWERLLVPAFVYFFALLFPMRWVNRPGARTAAAAGGCDLLRRSALERIGGLAAIRAAIIDDVVLAGAVKRRGGAVFLGLADAAESVRLYPGLGGLWHMVARSAYAQLRHSPLLALGTVVGLALVFLVPPCPQCSVWWSIRC
jgi:hopene-associated glycosyltransferase HpnB